MREKFVAYVNSQRIISVRAENFEAAKKEITYQLGKPGRYQILEQWQKSGEKIIIESES